MVMTYGGLMVHDMNLVEVRKTVGARVKYLFFLLQVSPIF